MKMISIIALLCSLVACHDGKKEYMIRFIGNKEYQIEGTKDIYWLDDRFKVGDTVIAGGEIGWRAVIIKEL